MPFNVRGRFSPSRRPFVDCLVPVVFSIAVFVSAALLFAIQPMFTKLALPRLGGSPSVWSVAVVFFEIALLVGYVYAHIISRTLVPRHAALVHLVVLGGAALALPIGIAGGFENAPENGVSFWVFGLFAASIGLPFVALSATAPLLQNWFGSSARTEDRNPFVLYAASNLGSFAGLLLYPFVLEPLLPVSLQIRLWSGGFAVLAMLLATAAALAVVSPADVARTAAAEPEAAPTWSRRFAWVALAGIPCGLVIAVTAHISTDVAPAPFLWVVPLALYLLTFVAVFRDHPWVSQAKIARAAPLMVVVLILLPFALSAMGAGEINWVLTILLDLAAFTVLTLLCHCELYRLRPSTTRLTEYYLYVALGGALGGGLTGLLAPLVFSSTYEYPILVTAALLALPGLFDHGLRAAFRSALPVLVVIAALVVVWLSLGRRLPQAVDLTLARLIALLAAFMVTQANRPARFVALTALAFVGMEIYQPGLQQVETMRSFFGVHKIAESADGTHRLLFHGTTIHGVERIRTPDGMPVQGRPEPTTYYYLGGPINESIVATRQARGRLDQVAVVGLGTGSMACLAGPDETWTFFEIDPVVVRLAYDSSRFRFMSECSTPGSVVLGDARLTLASAWRFDLIALDSFTSDAIPTHLLTREAFRIYLDHLTPHGVIIAHVSNRHMELSPILAATAAREGLQAWYRRDTISSDFERTYRAAAIVVVLARDPADVGDLARRPEWVKLAPDPRIAPWSDDYSNLLGAIWRKKFGS